MRLVGLTLLEHVGEFMGDEPSPALRRRHVLAGGEDDVAAKRVGTRLQRSCRQRGGTVGVDPHGREVGTEAVLECGLDRRLERAPGALQRHVDRARRRPRWRLCVRHVR